MSKCFDIKAHGYQSALSRYFDLEIYMQKGVEYQCQTLPAPPPASSGLGVAQKLYLMSGYRKEVSITICKNLAVLIEAKKQHLRQGIKEKKR